MRFLHAADVHLDSPMRGLDEYEGAPVQELRGATRRAFTALVQLAVSEHVDFVVLAGDLYDGDWPDYNTGLFFLKSVKELDRAGIPVVLLTGNHDAASRITSQLTLPPNVHSLPTEEAGTIAFDHLRVAVHGQGFARQAEVRNLVASYPAPVAGFFNVGVLHTALDGREDHAPYAPCTKEELVARGYDYWALGHIHKREAVNGNRHPRIEFPGNIQGRHVRETGARGCLIVTVDARGQAIPEFRTLDTFRWEIVSVNANDADTLLDVVESARVAISVAREGADGRPLAVRVVVSCSPQLSQAIALNRDQFRADLCGQAGNDIWIEKVKLTPIGTTRSIPTVSEDATSELISVLDELKNEPEGVREVLSSSDFNKFSNRLPPNLRSILDQSWDEVFARASALLQSGSSEGVE